jgi:hypothetical protein
LSRARCDSKATSSRPATFLATWAVELAVHHLDLGRDLVLALPAPTAFALPA